MLILFCIGYFCVKLQRIRDAFFHVLINFTIMPQVARPRPGTYYDSAQKKVDAYNSKTPQQKLDAIRKGYTRKRQVIGYGGQITTMTGMEGKLRDSSTEKKGLSQAEANNRYRLIGANAAQSQNVNPFNAFQKKR